MNFQKKKKKKEAHFRLVNGESEGFKIPYWSKMVSAPQAEKSLQHPKTAPATREVEIVPLAGGLNALFATRTPEKLQMK